MNPLEDRLQKFAEDELMFNAVRTALETQFDLNIQLKDGMADHEIFEIVRGVLDGRARLQKGFKALERYRKRPETTTTNQNNV